MESTIRNIVREEILKFRNEELEKIETENEMFEQKNTTVTGFIMIIGSLLMAFLVAYVSNSQLNFSYYFSIFLPLYLIASVWTIFIIFGSKVKVKMKQLFIIVPSLLMLISIMLPIILFSLR